MASKHVEFIVKLRDSAHMIADAAEDFIRSMAPPELGLESQPAVVVEVTFSSLKWEAQKGSLLGDFEIAHKNNNLPDKWSSACDILRVNNSTIKDRYYGDNYQFSYWLYGEDKIYRQKLKPKSSG